MDWTIVRVVAAAVVVLAVVNNLVLLVAEPEIDLMWEIGGPLLVVGVIAAVYLIYSFLRGRRTRKPDYP